MRAQRGSLQHWFRGARRIAALTVTLLVLSTISSTMHALLYILIFGIGSMVGMVVISLLLAVPLNLARERMAGAMRPIQVGTGVFSCLFGFYLGISILMNLQ